MTMTNRGIQYPTLSNPSYVCGTVVRLKRAKKYQFTMCLISSSMDAMTTQKMYQMSDVINASVSIVLDQVHIRWVGRGGGACSLIL